MTRAFRPAPDIADGLAAVVARLREQAGGIKVAAHHMGVSPATVSRYADRAAPDLPCFAQIASLTRATGASAAAEFLAELAGGRFIAGAGEEDSPVSDAGRAVVGEASEIIWQITDALRDGHIAPAEWRRIERAAADMQEALAALLAAGRKKRGRA